MNPIFSSLKANDPYEILISNIIQYESQPKFDLEDRQDARTRFKTVLSDFDSTVSTLHTLAKDFTDRFKNPFDARTANLEGSKVATASVTEDAAFGTHSLSVERLAATDTRLSQQYTSAGTSLRSFFDANGAQTFSIDVANPTDADPNNRASISVTVDPAGTSDGDILQEISNAINDAMDTAAEAGTISKSEKSASSVVNETSTTSRLSLRSGGTGYENRLQFTDSAGGLLAALDVTNAGLSTGTGGGQVTAVGTSETDSELNAKFTLDGLTLYRGSNTVDDALTGVTLTLKQISEGTETTDFTVGTDTDSIRGDVKDFIKKYNDVLDFIQGRSEVDAELGVRGDFAGESAFRSLRYNMRSDLVREVPGQPEGFQLLKDIGITIGEDGTLSLNAETFDEALAADPDAMESLFVGDDGLVSRLKGRLESYVGSDGIIDNRIEAVDNEIDRIKDRVTDYEDRLTQRENQLRAQFARMQETIAVLQGQQQNLGSFFGGF